MPTHLVNSEVGVRADDRSAAEVHTLSAQVASEAALLTLEALHEAPAQNAVDKRMRGFSIVLIVHCLPLRRCTKPLYKMQWTNE